MGSHLTIFGTAQVAPIQVTNPETGEQEDGKELQLIDTDSGRIYRYPMGKELANRVGKDLRMTNAALKAKIEEELAKQAARETIMGGNGGAVLGPDGQALAREIIDSARQTEN